MIVIAIFAASDARAPLALSASSGVVVLIGVTIPSVDVCLRHDNTSFVLYSSMGNNIIYVRIQKATL